MTQRAAVVMVCFFSAAGCQREKGAGGGGAALDFPSDTTALIGFVRKGPAPDAAVLKKAIEEVSHEKVDREMAELIDACVAPLGPHLDRTTIAVRGSLKDSNVVVYASGHGLRAAVEGCFKAMADNRDKPFTPGQDGAFTSYPLGGSDPVVARWSGGGDELVIAARKEQVESAVGATAGFKATPLGKVAGEVDRSARVWFAAAGPDLPPEAELESATGTIQDLTGSVKAVFKTPEAASKLGGMAQMVIPKGVKVAGKEVTIGVDVVDLPTLIPDADKKGPPLSKESANALLDAGPLVFGFVLFAARSDQPVEAPPPVPSDAPPAAEPVAPPPN
jgi:hypothetical protein